MYKMLMYAAIQDSVVSRLSANLKSLPLASNQTTSPQPPTP